LPMYDCCEGVKESDSRAVAAVFDRRISESRASAVIDRRYSRILSHLLGDSPVVNDPG
jgi:hypothetical protein